MAANRSLDAAPRFDRRYAPSTPKVPWFLWQRPTPKSIGREGMVTVWACDGLYLGCMGVETWKRLLKEGHGG